MTAMVLAQIEQQPELPFLINDADNHFVEPRDLYVNYVDPKWRHKAVTFEADKEGRWSTSLPTTSTASTPTPGRTTAGSTRRSAGAT